MEPLTRGEPSTIGCQSTAHVYLEVIRLLALRSGGDVVAVW